ncbi:MAG: GerMN domain-containing protein [Cyanobacteria bacterium P01_C01_bin.120]
MEDKTTRRRPSLGIVIALSAVILSAGSATAWFTWRSLSPPEPIADFPELDIEGEVIPEGFDPPASESIEVPDPPESEVAANPTPRTSTLYWLSMDGTTVALNPVTIEVPTDASAADTLQVAFANLMDGPEAEGVASGIPEETELLAIAIESDGVHVDLTEDFTFGGGSASMIGRLAQVVYTATALEPAAPVWIDVEGKPLRLLGGEGLEIRQPITRADVATDFGVSAPPVAAD